MKHMSAAGLVLVMCVTTAAAAQKPATRASTAPAPPAVGENARDFVLKSIDDKSIALQELNPGGPVVLVVLRGWVGYDCPFCTKQVGSLIARKSQFADAKARVLLIYPGPAEDLKKHAEQFLKEPLPANFDLVLDPEYNFTNAYGVRWNAAGETAYPSTFVIDGGGVVRFVKVSKSHGGRATPKEILEALRPATH